jgi:hypothetical protein
MQASWAVGVGNGEVWAFCGLLFFYLCGERVK